MWKSYWLWNVCNWRDETFVEIQALSTSDVKHCILFKHKRKSHNKPGSGVWITEILCLCQRRTYRTEDNKFFVVVKIRPFSVFKYEKVLSQDQEESSLQNLGTLKHNKRIILLKLRNKFTSTKYFTPHTIRTWCFMVIY